MRKIMNCGVEHAMSNLILIKKSSVAQHLETKTHVNLCSIVNSNKKTRFKNNDRNEIRNEFIRDIMVAFASANIPAHKLENKYLRRAVQNCIAYQKCFYISRSVLHALNDHFENITSCWQTIDID